MIDLLDFSHKIRASLVAEGCDAKVLFGRSHLARMDNQGSGTANRVVVAPGAPTDGTWGSIEVPTKAHVRAYPGEVKHREQVTVDVWGYDSTAMADEGAQYRALRVLWNRVLRATGQALRVGAHTHTFWGTEPKLMSQPADRRHGERAQFTFAIDFDVRSVAPAVDVIGAEAAPPVPEVEP